jgi:hypothetical protein
LIPAPPKSMRQAPAYWPSPLTPPLRREEDFLFHSRSMRVIPTAAGQLSLPCVFRMLARGARRLRPGTICRMEGAWLHVCVANINETGVGPSAACPTRRVARIDLPGCSVDAVSRKATLDPSPQSQNARSVPRVRFLTRVLGLPLLLPPPRQFQPCATSLGSVSGGLIFLPSRRPFQ